MGSDDGAPAEGRFAPAIGGPPANGGVIPPLFMWPCKSATVIFTSPAAISCVQSARPCAPISGNCIWPRQRFTLTSVSSAEPVQGSEVTEISSGLVEVGIVIVATRMPVPARSSQPSGNFQSGWALSGAVRTLAKNSLIACSFSATAASGPTTFRNQALPPSGRIAASIRSDGSSELGLEAAATGGASLGTVYV